MTPPTAKEDDIDGANVSKFDTKSALNPQQNQMTETSTPEKRKSNHKPWLTQLCNPTAMKIPTSK